MGGNSYKYDKELFELLKQEYKERLKIQLTLGSYEKLRSFINKETLDEELNRIDNKKKGHKSEDKVSEDSIKRHFGLINSKTKPSLSSCSLYARKLGYLSWDDFCEKNPGAKIYMATTKGRHVYTEVSYEPDCYIMFGKESAGIPEEILKANPDTCVRIPMIGETRSLNLSNSVAIVLYEALRQNQFDHMKLQGELHRLRWDD